MKRRIFYVPQDKIKGFVQIVDINKLDTRLKGLNEKHEIRIEVIYEKQERAAMFDLVEFAEGTEEDD